MEAFALKRIGSTNIMAIEGDVTRQPVEVVVNSANDNLQHTEGVATAVVRTGGRVIQEESDAWIREHGPLRPGEAAITTGGMLQASHVIHAVGPAFADHDSDSILTAAITAALDAAVERGLGSLAFPMISSGRNGYPAEQAARVISEAVVEWSSRNLDALTEVRLVGFDHKDAALFAAALS